MCNKISKCEIKGDRYFVDKVEIQLREKPLQGLPNPGYPLFKRQS